MASDADWVEDVRRWCASVTATTVPAGASMRDNEAASTTAGDALAEPLGYEAAHPALQARHWPDAPHA